MNWKLDKDFNADEEVLANEELKPVFKSTIDVGCAIVERKTIANEYQHPASP